MKANPANNETLEEPRMTLPRRRLLAATAATALAAPWIGGTARAQAKQLKISHQFPGGTVDERRFPRPDVPPVRRRRSPSAPRAR